MADDPAPGPLPEREADNRTDFERFEELTKRLVAVPKREIDQARTNAALE